MTCMRFYIITTQCYFSILQAEKQLVVLNANLYFYSPYTTVTQTTVVTTNSATIESYTKTKPVSQSDNTLTYGPHENKAPFSEVCKKQAGNGSGM